MRKPHDNALCNKERSDFLGRRTEDNCAHEYGYDIPRLRDYTNHIL